MFMLRNRAGFALQEPHLLFEYPPTLVRSNSNFNILSRTAAPSRPNNGFTLRLGKEADRPSKWDILSVIASSLSIPLGAYRLHWLCIEKVRCFRRFSFLS